MPRSRAVVARAWDRLLPLDLLLLPRVVARKALVPQAMPIRLHELRIPTLVPERALTRGFRAAVWRAVSVRVLFVQPNFKTATRVE